MVASTVATASVGSTFTAGGDEPPTNTHGSSGGATCNAIGVGGGMNAGDSGIQGTGTTGTGADGSLPSAADASTITNPTQGSDAGAAFVRGFGVTRRRHDELDAKTPW